MIVSYKDELNKANLNNVFHFSEKYKSFDFSLLSYNVLAQELLEKNAFLYDWSDTLVLNWDYRKKLLLDEIKQFNADVSI